MKSRLFNLLKEIMEIRPPASLLKPLFIPKKLLMGPGPSNCSDRILAASGQQLLGHLDEDFLKIMEDVKLGIKYCFQTHNDFTFAVSGTGHCAMEMTICNVLEPGDVLLCASSGFWGTRVMEICKRLRIECHQLKTPIDEAVSIDSLEKAVSTLKPSACFICHGDSSTGVLQPLEGFGTMLQNYSSLLLVDCVASLGAAPLYMDKYGIDVLYSGSQKILNAPPGLSPISFSCKAMQKMKERKSPVPSFYMDAFLIGNYWKCDTGKISYHHTAPINLVYALREALSIISSETLEKSWEKHGVCAETLYEELTKMGLELFVSEKVHRLPSITTVKIPNSTNGLKVIQHMRDRFQIDIAGGLGATAGQVWRIGLMGFNCTEKNVQKIIEALKESIEVASLQTSL